MKYGDDKVKMVMIHVHEHLFEKTYSKANAKSKAKPTARLLLRTFSEDSKAQIRRSWV
jgi:hypothetical protein